MLQQILAAFLVLGLLVATLWLLRRKGYASLNLALPKRASATREIELIERISLSAHHSLHLVRVHNRTILIGVSPSGCQRIASFGNSSGEARN